MWAVRTSPVLTLTRRRTRRDWPYASIVRSQGGPSIDPKTLLHRVTLVPDIHVVRGQLWRPFRRQLIHTGNRNAIDVVVEDRPRIAAAIQGREAFTWCSRLQCCRRGRLEVV